MVRDRVIEINRLTELNAWRYLKSKDMMADLGTRNGARVEDITRNSEWVNGKAWMRLCESEFPVSIVSEIIQSGTDKSDVSKECNKPAITEQICSSNSYCFAQAGCFSGAVVPDLVKSRYEFSQYIINPNWYRLREIVRIISLVYLFVRKCYLACGFRGRLENHPEVTLDPVPAILSCEGDQYLVTTGCQNIESPFRCLGGWVVCLSNNEVKLAMTYLFQKATEEVKQFLVPPVYNSISTVIAGILYYTGRILSSMEGARGATVV